MIDDQTRRAFERAMTRSDPALAPVTGGVNRSRRQRAPRPNYPVTFESSPKGFADAVARFKTLHPTTRAWTELVETKIFDAFLRVVGEDRIDLNQLMPNYVNVFVSGRCALYVEAGRLTTFTRVSDEQEMTTNTPHRPRESDPVYVLNFPNRRRRV